MIFLHLAVALITQVFGLFTYYFVLAIHIIVCLFIILKTNFKEIFKYIRHNIIKIDWVLLVIIAIIFTSLYSVHYNYSGKYSVVSGVYQQAEHMKYPYPYFSDEWYAVAFIKESIEKQTLPFQHPLHWEDTQPGFYNLEFPFHSFLAELMVLLNLDPVTNYTILIIFSGLLICLLVYFFLRLNKLHKLSAAVSSLSILYIVNSSTLPGIWFLIPLILGILSMILGFFFIASKNKRMIVVSTILTLLFYPPLFIVYTPAIIIFYFLRSDWALRKKIKNIAYHLILLIDIAIIISFIYFLSGGSFVNFFAYISSKIYYINFIEIGTPDFKLWYIVPIFIIALFIPGIISLLKKKMYWLLTIVGIGLILWLVYSLYPARLIIGYERIVVLTAIIITLIAGFGLDYLINILRKSFSFFRSSDIWNYILLVVLIIFILFVPNYTKRENWLKLKLSDQETGKVYLPAAPANQYLTSEDIKLFDTISKWECSFLSPPWKGTVIGVVSSCYPLATKPGTITNNRFLYHDFMRADCQKKAQIAENNYISVFYTPKFDCPGFDLDYISQEGLYLYYYNKIED